MTNVSKFKIGLALNHIANACDDATNKRIKPFLDTIEAIVLEEPLTEEKEASNV